MTNQLVRIGQLLVDLGRDLPKGADALKVQDVRMEFIRIRSCLLLIWSQRPRELLYVLEFHLAEAGRLLDLCGRVELRRNGASKCSVDGFFGIG